MIGLIEQERVFSMEETAALLGINEARLGNLVHKIEGSGYLFQRSETGVLKLAEKDIMMILCFT